MLFLVECENENCEHVVFFQERPLHESVINGWSLSDPKLRHHVICEMGVYVKVVYSGSGWHHEHGELPKITLVRTEEKDLVR